jgi:hypothetical protein
MIHIWIPTQYIIITLQIMVAVMACYLTVSIVGRGWGEPVQPSPRGT